MAELKNQDADVRVSVSTLNLKPLHSALLVLMGNCQTVKSRVTTALFMWLTEIHGNVYPGTQTLADLMGSDRFMVRRAEQQLAEAGLVTFGGAGRERTFKVTPTGEVFQSQLIAYNEIFAAPVDKSIPKRRKKQGETVVPADVIDKRPEPKTDPQQPANGGTAQQESHPEIFKTRSKLPPEDVSKICSDLNSMVLYLLYGREAVYNPQGTYPPSKLNWERFKKSPQDPGVDDWSAQQFMGFYWAEVSKYRTARGIPLSLPVWSKLGGHMANLLTQVPKPQLFNIITFVIYYFDLIKALLGRAGNTVFLEDDSLVNPLIQNTSRQLMAMTDPERAALLEQYGFTRKV